MAAATASGEPTPAELRALAARAEALAADIDTVHQRLRAQEEPTSSAALATLCAIELVNGLQWRARRDVTKS